jgi:putative membrane protein insertion efficiency factor
MAQRSRSHPPELLTTRLAAAPAGAARALIRFYQLTFSAIFGRTCRHLPSCSEYADEAIARHGLWPGLWMAVARFWRCRPLGSHGLDPVPETLPARAAWFTPWRYGRWTGRHIEHGFYTTDDA